MKQSLHALLYPCEEFWPSVQVPPAKESTTCLKKVQALKLINNNEPIFLQCVVANILKEVK